MRATKHSGRAHKNGGVYNPKHNDRTFKLTHEITGNFYWNYYSENGIYYDETKSNELNFVDAEKKYYEEHFRDQYDDIMSRYKKNRHIEKIKSFDDWRQTKQYAPEEIYYQIGNMENHVDEQTFVDCFMDYMAWESEWNKNHGYPFQVLDFSFHADEAVPQMHVRRVWQYVDDDGILRIGQDKALEQAGVSLPHPDKKRTRYNNRKVTFDRECRDKWLEICKNHGLEIEMEPLPDGKGKHNRSKEQFINDKYEEKLKTIQSIDNREKALEARETLLEARERDLEAREQKLSESTLNAREKALEARERDLEARETVVCQASKEIIARYKESLQYYNQEQQWANTEYKKHLREARNKANAKMQDVKQIANRVQKHGKHEYSDEYQ